MTVMTHLAMIWRPFFPLAPTAMGVAVLLGLAVFVCVRTIRQQPGLSVATMLMRLGLITTLGLLLMGPSGIEPTARSQKKPTLHLLIDTSASMQTPDTDSMPRFEFVSQRWLTPERLHDLRDLYDVELLAIDESSRTILDEVLRLPASQAATAGVSNIAQAVSDAVIRADGATAGGMSGGTSGGAVVLTDGRDTLDTPMHPVGQLAKARSVPIYTVPLGGPSMSRDVALIAVPDQPYLFAQEPGRIMVRVMQSNAGQSQTVLHVDQGDARESFPIVFNGHDSVTVDVPISHDEPGMYEYQVYADTITGEAEASNNAQPVFMEVTAKRLRVLILEGQPYWDTKFLAHALRKDSRIELTQITQVSSDKRETIVSREGAVAGVPKSLTDLAQFDVIILGREIGNVLDAGTAGLLARYVSEHGGRLVFARGRAYDPKTSVGQSLVNAMSVVEPVVFGEGVLRNQRIALEPAGMIHPSFNAGAGLEGYAAARGDDAMPTLLNMPVATREKVATRVLARTQSTGAGGGNSGQPAIVTMPYGQGVVVAILGDGLWKWGLRPRRSDSSSVSFDRFWMDMIRWLALGSDYQPGKPISLRLSRRGVQAGDPISLDLISRIGFDELDARVYVQGPNGERLNPVVESVMGSTTRRRAVLHPKKTGVYRVAVESPLLVDGPIEAKFNCYNVDLERLHTAANRGALRTLSEISGGRVLDSNDPNSLTRLLKQQREAAMTPPRPYYLWDRGWVMVLLLMWAGMEWLIRRAGGML
jgi:hypothetical protein